MFQFLKLGIPKFDRANQFELDSDSKKSKSKTLPSTTKYHALLIKTMNNFVKYISFTYTYYIDKEKSNVWNLNTKI